MENGEASTARWHLFETELKWMSASWVDDRLTRLFFGQSSPQRAVVALAIGLDWREEETAVMRDARRRLSLFAKGQAVSLATIDIDLERRTPFQRTILSRCREVAWGSTMSYGALATACGFPRAARAVGSVMRSNRHPLIVPCHRIVAANGGIGGYSAHDGVATKSALLAREGARRGTV